MDDKKPLIFIHPLTSTLKELKKASEESAEEDGVEIYEVDELTEFEQLFATIGQSVCLFSDPKKCAKALQSSKRAMKELKSKVILVSRKPIGPKTLEKFNKVGLTECIAEPVVLKTLMYKVKLQLRSITGQAEDSNSQEQNSSTKQEDKTETQQEDQYYRGQVEKRESKEAEEHQSQRFEKDKDSEKQESHWKGHVQKNVNSESHTEEERSSYKEAALESYYKHKTQKSVELEIEKQAAEPKCPSALKGDEEAQQKKKDFSLELSTTDSPPHKKQKESDDEQNYIQNSNTSKKKDDEDAQKTESSVIENQEEDHCAKEKEEATKYSARKKDYDLDLDSEKEKTNKQKNKDQESSKRDLSKQLKIQPASPRHHGHPKKKENKSPSSHTSSTHNKEKPDNKADNRADKIDKYYKGKGNLHKEQEWKDLHERQGRLIKPQSSSKKSSGSQPEDGSDSSSKHPELFEDTAQNKKDGPHYDITPKEKKDAGEIHYASNQRGEQTIDYEKLKEEFDAVTPSEKNQEQIDIEESSAQPPQSDDHVSIIDPSPCGLVEVIQNSFNYHQRGMTFKDFLFYMAQKIYERHSGITSFYSFKESSDEALLDFCPFQGLTPLQMESDLNEKWQELKVIKWPFWKQMKLPAWSDSSFKDQEIDFFYPYVQNSKCIGFAIVFLPQGFSASSSSDLEVYLESARGFYTQEIREPGLGTHNKESRQKERLLSSFFGKKVS